MEGFRTIVKKYVAPVYDCYITLIVYDDYKKCNSALKRKGFTSKVDEADGGACHSEIINQGTQYYLVLKVKDNNDLGNTLIHELFHLTQNILEDRSIIFKKGDANEPYAYLIGCLYELMYKDIKELV